MAETLDWRTFRDGEVERLLRTTGVDLETWNARIREAGLSDRASITAWLAERGVTGYSAMILRWERLGYPDHMTATAGALIAGQYADRPDLRPLYEAILQACLEVGDVTVQMRKTYVSLLTPRRTFVRIQATTRKRIDAGLRLAAAPGGRLRPCRQENMPVQLSFEGLEDLDDEARSWLAKAYEENL